MTATHRASEAAPPTRRQLLVLWSGVLGPPLAFLLNLELTYAAAGLFCEARLESRLLVHVVPATMLLVSIALGMSSFIHWHRLGGGEAAEGSVRVLAVLGVLSASFFTLMIVAQWLPSFLLDPCLPPQ
jgi:hypothetical protein